MSVIGWLSGPRHS